MPWTVRLAAPVEDPAPTTLYLLYWNTIAALVCIIAAIAGLGLAPLMDKIAAISPAIGVALAAFLVCGNRVAPGIFLANFLVHAFLKVPMPAALPISAAATVGPATAAWILRRLKLDLSLGSVRDTVRYTAVACLQAVIAAPTVGVIALAAAQSLSWQDAADLWGSWAMAACLSVLVVSPPLLWMFRSASSGWRHSHSLEFALSTALLFAVTGACYSISRPIGYPVLLVVMLIAVRYSQREVGIAVMGVVAVAIWEIMHRELLHLTGETPAIPRVLEFLLFLSAGSLLLSSLVAEGRRKDAALLRANQDRLEQSETRFEDAFTSAANGWGIMNLSGRWLRVNAALCRLVGYSEAYLLTQNRPSITHPEDIALDQEQISKILTGEIGGSQYEKRYIHSDGRVIVVLLSISLVRDAGGAPLNFVVQVMDVTDRKRAEELWRFGLENAGDVVWDWDIPSKRIVFSGKVKDLLGSAPGQAPDTVSGWRALIHPDDAVEAKKKTNLLLEVPGYSYSSEYRVRCADGTYKWVLSRGLVMSRDRDDNPIRAVGTLVDITEVQRLQEKLHQSDKMAALGQLTGGVAHDVNNDLGVIVGSAELILDRAASGSREEILSSRIITTVQRSRDLVRRMLAFSRQAEIAPEPLELASFLKGFSDTLGRTLGAHIQVRVHTADLAASYWVNLDRGMLESSLINLTVNARDAMAAGGILTLSLATEPGKTGEADTVLLTVADSGTGMSEALQRRIFEPFFTTKPAGGGTGLGLAMVHGFVQQSGGRIDVESRLGAGTRFLLRFPAKAPPDLARNQAPRPPSGPMARTVLVVDDNDTLRLTLREQLTSLNCSVREAENFEKAVAILRSGVKIDFILSDLDLGSGPDGLAFALWARENGYPVPGAIMSGHLNSITGLPENWQSVQKPIQLNGLRVLLAASGGRGTVSTKGQDASSDYPVILVVEDNVDMRLVAVEILKREGYRLAEAATAQEALHMLEDNPDIRLVISDVGLPDMSGSQLAENIRRLRPATCVRLMTGTFSLRRSSDREPGAGQILQKPFTRESLTRFVEDALAQSPG
jgi:PAS domain S-box-containing protein